MKKLITPCIAALAVLTASHLALGGYDQNVTPGVIFGSGNANGSFTVTQANGIELGLRGKLRFDENNLPQNTFNSNGDGTYTFQAGAAPTGFGWQPNSPTTPVWNFEWSINSNWDDTSGYNLDDLTYQLGLDFDPGAGTNFLVFDPINTAYADHSIGTNSTTDASDLMAGNSTEYANYIANNNVAQNSWNYEFFNDGPYAGFNPSVPGTYDITLKAYDGTNLLAETAIQIDIAAVPAPGALLLTSLGTGLVGWIRRRK